MRQERRVDNDDCRSRDGFMAVYVDETSGVAVGDEG